MLFDRFNFGPYLYRNLVANATTTLHTGPGKLVGISINTKGVTGNTLTVYDNTSGAGTKVATIDTTVSIGYLPLPANLLTGLTIVIATGTAADITVFWDDSVK